MPASIAVASARIGRGDCAAALRTGAFMPVE
jgi:hypothetical protein